MRVKALSSICIRPWSAIVRICIVAIALTLTLLLSACGAEATPTPNPTATLSPTTAPATITLQPTPTTAPATATLQPTPTSAPATATPQPTPSPSPTVVPTSAPATATPRPTPTSAPAAAITPTHSPTPQPTLTPEPTSTPTLTPTPQPAPTHSPTPQPTLTPTPHAASVADAAFARFNRQRESAGLAVLELVSEGDDAFTPVEEFVVGCDAAIDEYEELTRADIGGIALSLHTEGSECGLKVATYRATPTDVSTLTPTTPAQPTDTPTPQPTLTPTPIPAASVTDDAFARFNRQRQGAGLGVFAAAVDDDSFIPVQEFLVGCHANLDEYEELLRPDLHAIDLSLSAGGSECGLKVVTYHVVPESERMSVERGIWECFAESRDLREQSDVSCGGRFTFLGRHVKWLPGEVSYFIQEGEAQADRFRAYIPWIEDKLKVRVSEAESSQAANVILHLGVQSPANCPERYGCSVLEEVDGRSFATVYMSAPDEFFGQVLKHELLHSLLPMGHLPQGDYLMSVRPGDPSQTHELTAREEKLLKLYTHPYLRDGMTMEQFRRYLVVVE